MLFIKYVVYIFVLILVFSCNTETRFISKDFKSVELQYLLKDSLLSIRAIEILENHNLAFAANNNSYGLMNSETNQWKIAKVFSDSLDLYFRAVSHTKEDFFMLSMGNPAYLFRTTMFGMKLQYSEEHPKVFYDAMDFWNDKEGIAVGDPTSQCMSIIITRDGGKTWNKIPCKNLPQTNYGEAAFAASNTNIAIVENHTWIATGGYKSRVMYSSDKGHSWKVYDTPIIQDGSTTGIYSIDFYDQLHGFAIGGDYLKPHDNTSNKIRTVDGGKTWQLVGVNKNPGYSSCVQYVPNGKGQELVAVGLNGIYYSKDSGITWFQLSDEVFYTIRFINDNTAYAAGKGKICKLIFKE